MFYYYYYFIFGRTYYDTTVETTFGLMKRCEVDAIHTTLYEPIVIGIMFKTLIL
jgi:hypothetical protein